MPRLCKRKKTKSKITYPRNSKKKIAVPMRLLRVETASSIGTGRNAKISTFLSIPTRRVFFS